MREGDRSDEDGHLDISGYHFMSDNVAEMEADQERRRKEKGIFRSVSYRDLFIITNSIQTGRCVATPYCEIKLK